MSEILISVNNVSKKFCRSLKKSLWYGVKDIGAELFGRSATHEHLRESEFWANREISFELRRGECLGLIGRNGAGKTTLLRMLNGLIKPDKGRIEMRGRVGALIALGAGFNPILSGRENIYVNASVLGVSRRQIDAKIDEIIDFAEIGEFLDMPVQNYSSGMAVRLGFAVATTLEPDILILDEVLAVGDAAFRSKCYRRISDLQKNAAVIFVSHTMDQVARVCSQTLVLSQGKPVFLGNVGQGIDVYEQISEAGTAEEQSFVKLSGPINEFSAQLDSELVKSGEPLKFRVQVVSSASLNSFRFRIFFYNASGAFAADGTYLSEGGGLELPEGESVWDFKVAYVPLKNGVYRISFNLLDPQGEIIVWSYKQLQVRVVDSFPGATSDCQLQLLALS